MKSLLKNLGQILAVSFMYMLFFMIPTIIVPPSAELNSRLNAEEMQLFFPLLFIYSTYTGITYWLVRQHLAGEKIKLFLWFTLVHLIIFPLMGLLEAIYWYDAFSYISKNDFMRIAIRFKITYTLFSAFLVFTNKSTAIKSIYLNLNKTLLLKIGFIAINYYLIYNIFGYYVAWQFEETRVFYSGSAEMISFLESFVQNTSDLGFVGMHLFRGLLFGFAAYLFLNLINATRLQNQIILTLVFGGFGFQILLPNPVFPEVVRISHFLETTSSMLVFGWITAIILQWKQQ